jgi:hypothetical protein
VTSIKWAMSGCMPFPGGIAGWGTPDGFTRPDGGPDPSGPNVVFTCGSCCGQVSVGATLINDQALPGADAAVNVCEGAPFARIEGIKARARRGPRCRRCRRGCRRRLA